MEQNARELIVEAVEAAGVSGDIDQDIENELNNLANNANGQVLEPAGPGEGEDNPDPQGNSVIIIERDDHNSLQEFASSIREAASLFSTYNKTLRLIESSSSENFQHWSKLTECISEICQHPRVTDKMKMRCFLVNRDNVKTFRLLQGNFQLELDNLFYMGKMNLLHISCDTGWSDLAAELVTGQQMNVNLPCPSLHMRPGCLTPLMLAVGAGHLATVKVLLQAPSIELEQKDSYGMTAVFHACNHGFHRVGDKHGYFRRLWSWDLSQDQLDQMESLARDNALDILKVLVAAGANMFERDNTGASILTRAASVDNFVEIIKFLVLVGCKVTENVMNWIRVRNPDCSELVETSLRVPGTLLQQSRIKTWSLLRHSGGGGESLSYPDKMKALAKTEQIPVVLLDYLQCKI